MIDLPENWNEMTRLEKESWFVMYALSQERSGELGGLQNFVTERVKEAYAEFLKN
ncbi:MAG: hypothetical protein IKD69_11980 [Solobacterium sp.]|nr:hypothetical protein [Solobacterium sp.]